MSEEKLDVIEHLSKFSTIQEIVSYLYTMRDQNSNEESPNIYLDSDLDFILKLEGNYLSGDFVEFFGDEISNNITYVGFYGLDLIINSLLGNKFEGLLDAINHYILANNKVIDVKKSLEVSCQEFVETNHIYLSLKSKSFYTEVAEQLYKDYYESLLDLNQMPKLKEAEKLAETYLSAFHLEVDPSYHQLTFKIIMED